MDYNFTISSFADERAYHNTAILIYLKAVKSILGDVDVTIGNSLNQGYYSYINRDGVRLTSLDINKIRDRMNDIIARDYELVVEHDNVKHAMQKWFSLGYNEKARLLESREPDEEVEIVNLHNYRNCMYCKVLPSSGYIDLFDLRPYRTGLLLRLPNALNPHSIPKYRDDDKLYDAFAESNRLRRYSGINFLADLNRIIMEGRSDDLIRDSELLHTRQIGKFAASIIEKEKRIVLIAGPSSSGKTTTAKRICAEIEERTGEAPLYLGTDDYFVERSESPIGPDGKPDYEGLDCLDLKLFNAQMTDLLAGKEVDLPEFDFMNGTKVFGKRITKISPEQIIVIEGIHSLNDVLTADIPAKQKYKIYISPLTQIAIDRHNRISTADARLLRRMVRDNQFRGYNAEKTLEMWPKVRAGESVNVFPYSSSADAVFNSSTAYETNLLKTFAEPLLLAIPETSEQYEGAQRIMDFLKYFVPMDAAESVPDYSILREFIGPRK